jgi:hypothetical protein
MMTTRDMFQTTTGLDILHQLFETKVEHDHVRTVARILCENVELLAHFMIHSRRIDDHDISVHRKGHMQTCLGFQQLESLLGNGHHMRVHVVHVRIAQQFTTAVVGRNDGTGQILKRQFSLDTMCHGGFPTA